MDFDLQPDTPEIRAFRKEVREWLEENMTGGTASSFASLASGQVAGAVLTPPFDDKAVSKGFKKFMLIGDLLDIPTSGLIASRTEITNQRDKVQKTIAALVDAVTWIRANRTESVKMIADKFKITPAEANGTYETLVSMIEANRNNLTQISALSKKISQIKQEIEDLYRAYAE